MDFYMDLPTHPTKKKVPADVLMVLVGETCGFRSGGSV
jgi:hypothetical protein